ncbi:MAG: DNA topoisomerase III [Lachnospiraceae bacterium]|nr:DNA topoisomerase III [Lachnospiraceae bacterium]
MKQLVLAEKPSVGRDIARVLGCKKPVNGGLEGKEYIVTWALGHLVELMEPEGYDKKYQNWKMEDLPMMPEKMRVKVIPKTAKQYRAVTALMNRKDVNVIIIATDAGREGELVARYILLKNHNKKPIKRLWISSVTDKAIREGFNNLKDGREYNRLYEAAMSRAEADWLVGMNATRALTCKHNAQLSAGRVQTPTLSLIAAREEEIRAFKPKTYYGLEAWQGGVKFIWCNKKNQTTVFHKEFMDDVEKKVAGTPITIKNVNKQSKKSYAPALYDLNELQRDASQRYHFSPKQTLNIMQRLYEHHKILTYPRTDSRYLTDDIVPTIPERLRSCGIGPYKKVAAQLLRGKIKANKSFVNNAKVSDHHAIIPTEQTVHLTDLSSDERKIYDLVVCRFLAVLLPAYEYEEMKVVGEANGEIFKASFDRPIALGWKEVNALGNTLSIEETGKKFPLMKVGDCLDVTYKKTSGKTNPPAYYSEASLLTAMEKKGLGTVATRADIIDKLFNTFLLEKKEEGIRTTGKAKQLLSLVPEDLKKPELTAEWEKKLTRISDGKLPRRVFMNEIKDYTVSLVDEVKGSEGTFRHDNLTNKKCPQCGKRLLRVKGKKSTMLVCQDRECGYRETISVMSNARCPQCHKKMEMVGKGEDKMFTCSCGYREKLAKFQERKAAAGGGVTKKDVRAYMKKQQKEAKEPVNTGFADLLKDLKL